MQVNILQSKKHKVLFKA